MRLTKFLEDLERNSRYQELLKRFIEEGRPNIYSNLVISDLVHTASINHDFLKATGIDPFSSAKFQNNLARLFIYLLARYESSEDFSCQVENMLINLLSKVGSKDE